MKFRSDRHFICNPCSGSLRQSEPMLLLPGNAADKAKRKQRVKTNDESYDSHCALVEKYEDHMNGKTPRMLKLKGGKRKRGDDEGAAAAGEDHGSGDEGHDHDKAVAVSSAHGTELSARTLLGILWPSKLFKDVVKRKPSKKEVVVVTIGGKKCTGVLRDPKHGTPLGTTEVWQTAFAKAESQTALSNSSTQLREGETEDWYRAAAQAVSFSAKEFGEGDEATLALRGGAGSSSKRACADDDLDLTWDVGVDIEGGAVSDDDQANLRRQRNKKQRGDVTPKITRIPTASPKTKGPTAIRKDKEVNISEKVLLELTQAMRTLQNADTYKNVTVKMARGFVDRVAARTTPELVAIYSAAFEGTSSSGDPKDMKILEDLTNAKATAQKMLALVAAIHATSGPESSGQALLQAVREAMDEEAILDAEKDTTFYMEMAIDRELMMASAAKQFKHMAEILDPERETEPSKVSVRLLQEALGAKEWAIVQDKKITKGLVDLLRQPEGGDAVVAYLEAMRSAKVLSEDLEDDAMGQSIAGEMAVLRKIASPWEVSLTDLDLAEAKGKLEKGTTMRIHKCMTLFPTGQRLMEEAAVAITKRTADAACEQKLTEMLALLGSGGALHPFCKSGGDDETFDMEHCLGHVIMTTKGDITISTDLTAALKLMTCHLSYLKANGSPRFSDQHKDTLAMLAQLLDTFAEVLQEKITAHIRSLMQPVFVKATGLLQALQVHGDGHQKAVQAAVPLKEVLATFGNWAMHEQSPKDLLQCMVLPEHVLEISTFWEAARNSVLVLKFSLELLCERSFPTLENENVQALHDLLDKPLRAMQTADGYQVFNEHCIQAMLRTATTAILKSIPESVLSAVLPLLSGGDGADAWATANLKQLTDLDLSTLAPVRQCAALISQHFSTLQSKAVKVKGCTTAMAFLVHMPEIVLALHHMLKHRACEKVVTEDVFKDGGLLTGLAELQKVMESIKCCSFLAQGEGERFAQKLLSETDTAQAALVDKALAAMKKDLGDHRDNLEQAQAQEGEAKSNVATMMNMAETKSFSPEVLARMLKLAQSGNARAFYEAWKSMRRIQLDYVINRDAWDRFTEKAALQVEVVALLNYDLGKASVVVATVTAVQALGRPLKKDEARKKICEMALATIRTKVGNKDSPITLPPSILAALQERCGQAQ